MDCELYNHSAAQKTGKFIKDYWEEKTSIISTWSHMSRVNVLAGNEQYLRKEFKLSVPNWNLNRTVTHRICRWVFIFYYGKFQA
jgi:hypothetical protein